MKKVVCARCELVNLDTFPAFPLCEACGARLPSMRRFGWHGPLRRPTLPLVWAIVLGAGVAMLGLSSLGLARDTRRGERGTLALDGRSAPDQRDARAQIWTLILRPADANDTEPLRALRLRLSRKDEQLWHFLVLSPSPTRVQTLGSGRYFDWSALPRRASFQLRLVAPAPLRPDAAPLHLWWTAEGFEPLPFAVRPSDAGALWNRTGKSFTLKP